MLKKLTIKNFKPYGDIASVRLAPITLIYGPNSSGKSSIIQSLLMMNQTLNSEQARGRNDLITRGTNVDLGNFSSILHRHDEDKTLQLGYEFSARSSSRSSASMDDRFRRGGVANPFAGVTLDFNAVRLAERHVVPLLNSVSLKVNDFNNKNFEFCLNRSASAAAAQLRRELGEDLEEDVDAPEGSPELGGAGESQRGDLFQLGGDVPVNELTQFLHNYWENYSFARRSGQNAYLPPVHKIDDGLNINWELLKDLKLRRSRKRFLGNDFLPSEIIGDEANVDDRFAACTKSFSDVMQRFDKKLQQTLRGLSYLGPLRNHPARHYVLDGVPGTSVGSRGEQVVQILFHDLQKENGRSPLLNCLNEYCVKFEIPYKFDLRNVGDEVTGDVIVLSLTDTRTNVRVGPADVGFGIGQLLPILIEGILINERQLTSRMVCVEQPEIHLHPRLQAVMADFFIDTAMIGSERSGIFSFNRFNKFNGMQWILETHSEALMLRLQRRIREGLITNEDVCVLYVDPRGEKGSVIQELRLDSDGEFIDLWPDGFFVESLSEMMGGR
jgi:hypothetical protein